MLAGLTLAATLAAVGFKLLTATKVIGSPKLGYLLSLIRQALWIDGVVYGLAGPRTLWRAARLADSTDIIIAISLAAAATWYLRMVMTEEAGSWRWRPWDLVAGGTLVAALGLGVFVGTPVSFHPSGPNNRIAIASAAGVAMATVGLIASVTARLALTVRTWAFAWAGGTVIGASALMSGAITTQWVQAAARALTVLEKVTRTLPTLRSGTTVLLVGTCPYVGPGIVFESSWDLRGALWLHYGDTTLLADVVTASTRVAGDGVHTKIYGSESIYPYGSLLAVDAARETARPLRDSATAADYLQTLNRGATACPRGHEGHGVRIF
jgi:hypothetical protein